MTKLPDESKRTKSREQSSCGEVDDGHRLLSGYALVAIEKFPEAVAGAEMVEERLHRNACSFEARLTVHAGEVKPYVSGERTVLRDQLLR